MEHHYKQLEPGCIFYFPIFAEKKLIEKKSMKRMILLLSFLMSWMYGQITLEECRQKTQDNYPLVRQYSLIEKTKEYNLNNASKGNLPQFSLSAKASYQSDVTELPVKIPGIDRSVSSDAGAETEHLGWGRDTFEKREDTCIV
mgnify:CR=1 FL=1